MRTVTLYTRAGCCLCDEAHRALDRVRAGRPFVLEVIDIERDDALHRRYLERIPVVAVDGLEAFEYEVDEASLAARLDDFASN